MIVTTKQMIVRRRSALPLAAGMITAQAVATLFVRHSNMGLLDRIDAVTAAGWMAVPAGPAAANLNTLATAIWGGLFFTLSIGAGLSLLSWAALYLWFWGFHANRWLLACLAVIWMGLLVAVNTNGWAFYPSLFVLLTPGATIIAALKPTSTTKPQPAPRSWAVSLPVLVLLAVVWATQFNAQVFFTIRDHLLLSNAPGRMVNDFYYRYTLFAAEAFKSLGQKSFRTWYLDPASHSRASTRFVTVLADNDVLETPGFAHADLVIHRFDERLRLIGPDGMTLEVAAASFLAEPNRWLRIFSEATDRHAPFRRLVFAGLLVGFPTMLFVAAHGAVGRMAGRLTPFAPAEWIASGFCLAFGLLLLLPVLAGRPEIIPQDGFETALSSPDWRRRVAALRHVDTQGMDIADFHVHTALLKSPNVAERYWLARVLALSRDAGADAHLRVLMNDPHPNVVCQAYYALGRRGNSGAIAAIHAHMTQSDHWYIQWYGYRAMRALGWRQSQCRSEP